MEQSDPQNRHLRCEEQLQLKKVGLCGRPSQLIISTSFYHPAANLIHITPLYSNPVTNGHTNHLKLKSTDGIALLQTHHTKLRMERKAYTLWALCGHVTHHLDPSAGRHWEPNRSIITEDECPDCNYDPQYRMQSPTFQTLTENPDLEIKLRLLRIKFIFIQIKDLQIGQRRQFRQIRELEGDWRAMTDPAIRVMIDQKRESLETGIELERRISEDLVTIMTASGGQLHFRQREGGDNTMDSLLNDMADAVYRMTHGGQGPPPPGFSPRELKAEAIKLILVSVPIESVTAENLNCAICLETMGKASKNTEAELPTHLPLCNKHPCGNRCLTEWLQDNVTCPVCRSEYSKEIASALSRVREKHGLNYNQ
jgi:hypothetical protein